MDKVELTKNQNLVLSILRSSDQPLGAYEILERLQSTGLRAPLQIYRALERLQSLGVVHRLEGQSAYIACCQTQPQHSKCYVLASCSQCDKVAESSDLVLEKTMREVAKKMQFHWNTKSKDTVIEMRGLCSRCHEQSTSS